MKPPLKNLGIWLIVALALALRLLAILRVGDFSWDEIFSFVFSQTPWGESWRYFVLETNPPAHLFFLKLWFLVAPATEFFARLPSLLAGILSVLTVHRLGKIWFNKTVGWLAALSTALSPLLIYASVLNRVYVFLFLLSALSGYFLYKIIFLKPTGRDWALYALIHLALVFSHLTAFPLIAGEFCALLCALAFNPQTKNKIYAWILIHLPIGALFALWAVPSFLAKLHNPAFGSAWFLNLERVKPVIFYLGYILFLSPHHWLNILALVAGGGAFALALIAAARHSREQAWRFIFPLVICAPTLLAIFAYRLWELKFVIAILPWLTLIIFYPLVLYWKKAFWLPALALFFAPMIWGLTDFTASLPISDWGKLTSCLNSKFQEKKGQTLVIEHFAEKLLTDRYYHGAIPAKVFYTGANFTDDLILNNYTLKPKIDAQSWYQNNRLEDAREIYLLRRHDMPLPMPKTLADNGWRQVGLLDNCAPTPRNDLIKYEKE